MSLSSHWPLWFQMRYPLLFKQMLPISKVFLSASFNISFFALGFQTLSFVIKKFNYDFFLSCFIVFILFGFTLPGGCRISSQLPAPAPTPLDWGVETPQPASAGRTGTGGSGSILFSPLGFLGWGGYCPKRFLFVVMPPFSLSFHWEKQAFLRDLFCLCLLVIQGWRLLQYPVQGM